MEYRRLGKAGVQVSVLSFGSWVTFQNQLDVERAESCMIAAYDAGVNFFDNAEAYAAGQSEIIMGKVLRKMSWPRSSYLVSSKVYFGGVQNPKPNQRGLSRKHVVEACNEALARLQVDYLDLYFCHRPDSHTPVEETVRAMSDLVRQGKVLYWGTSEWSADLIMEAHGIARQLNLVPPTMEQPQYNMFVRERFEREYRRLYSEIGLGTTIWSPLASGFLTGKYNEGVPKDSRMELPGYEWLRDQWLGEGAEEKIEKVRRVGEIAKGLGMSTAQFALAWCAKNPNVSTVITGASRPEQVRENMKAAEKLDTVTDDVMGKVEEILGDKT